MFKVGDKIRAKKNSMAYESYGKSILIVEKSCVPNDIRHVCYKEPNGKHSGWDAKWFELVDSKPKSEIEYLDCFKNNFEDGI